MKFADMKYDEQYKSMKYPEKLKIITKEWANLEPKDRAIYH